MTNGKTGKEERQEELKAIAEKFRDSKGKIDLAEMRKVEPKAYSRISYNFGNIENFLIEMGDGETLASGTSINRNIVRNKMCWDMFQYLREVKGLTFEDIGKEYGVSRMYMSKLYRELERVFGENSTLIEENDEAQDTIHSTNEG